MGNCCCKCSKYFQDENSLDQVLIITMTPIDSFIQINGEPNLIQYADNNLKIRDYNEYIVLNDQTYPIYRRLEYDEFTAFTTIKSELDDNEYIWKTIPFPF